jgi:hypothetical protein
VVSGRSRAAGRAVDAVEDVPFLVVGTDVNVEGCSLRGDVGDSAQHAAEDPIRSTRHRAHHQDRGQRAQDRTCVSSRHLEPIVNGLLRTRHVLTILLGLALGAQTSGVTGQKLATNAGVGVDALTQNQARLYFTMRLKAWPDGTPVKVFVLPDDNTLHREFSNQVLGLFPYQLRRVWDRQIFSGTGQAPITVSTEQEMRERLATTAGAIGYVSELADDPRIHAVTAH